MAVSREVLVAAVGREHRLGRWWNDKAAQNKLLITRLPHSSSGSSGSGSGSAWDMNDDDDDDDE